MFDLNSSLRLLSASSGILPHGAFIVLLGFAVQLGADEPTVARFLNQYCFECHDSLTQKGERDFEEFLLPLTSPSDVVTAKEIINQLT